MTIKNAPHFLIVLFFLFACAPADNGSSTFEAKVVSKRAFLIDAPMTSCQATTINDVPAVSMEIPSFSFMWKGTSSLEIKYMIVTLTGSNLTGKFQVTIAGDELLYIMNKGKVPATLTPNVEKIVAPDVGGCGIKIGSIPITDKKMPASGSGTIFVYGVYQEPDKSYNDARAQASFTFQFNGSF